MPPKYHLLKMSRCDFGGMIILPAKITSAQFQWMLTICQLNSLTGDYTYIHRIMYLQVYLLRYTTGYFHGGPKKISSWECFPIHEVGRIDGGRGFRTGKNMFKIGGNKLYNRKNKIPMKIPEFKRSRIGLIAESRGIPNGFPNQDNKRKLHISQSSPLSSQTYAWLLVSKLTTCVTSQAL